MPRWAVDPRVGETAQVKEFKVDWLAIGRLRDGATVSRQSYQVFEIDVPVYQQLRGHTVHIRDPAALLVV